MMGDRKCDHYYENHARLRNGFALHNNNVRQ